MEYSETNCFSLSGIDAQNVKIQAHINNGLPKFNIVGLGDKSVTEAKERVRSAFSAIGLSLPLNRITINLSPANLPKEGSHFDLAIATSLLAAQNIIPKSSIENSLFCGELGLNGSINKIPGVISAASFCKKHKLKLICPKDNYREASLLSGIEIIPVTTLLELVKYLKDNIEVSIPRNVPIVSNNKIHKKDFSNISGHFSAKRALEIAAAGKHNLLMIGPPGSGKSLLAESFPSILPNLTEEEALETTSIYSISNDNTNTLISSPPFCSPHHTASTIALAGGGKKVLPGEISLAHNGILFLDELPEFSSKTIEVLRQPMESGNIVIARADKHISFPARFQLLAAMNPCKCGQFFEKDRNCNKAPACMTNYLAKISGPIFDRIDMQITVNIQNFSLTKKTENEECSEKIKARVTRAQNKQKTTYQDKTYNYNRDLPLKDALNFLENNDLLSLLESINQKYNLSHRGLIKLVRVAKTISDLDNKEKISKEHIFEAISYKIRLTEN